MNFEYCVAEGEAQVRSLIIGYWDDSRNMSPRNYEGECELVSTGLVPMSQYVVGIVAFDDMNREKVFVTDLMTGDPVGPKPQLRSMPNGKRRHSALRQNTQLKSAPDSFRRAGSTNLSPAVRIWVP